MKVRTRSGIRIAALFTIILSAAGCDILGPPGGRADTARLELDGTSPGPLLVVTSTDWTYIYDEDTGRTLISLVAADTTEAELPFQKSVDLAPRYRILFRVVNPHEEEAHVRMRVLLDGELKHSVEGELGETPLEYTYRYN